MLAHPAICVGTERIHEVTEDLSGAGGVVHQVAMVRRQDRPHAYVLQKGEEIEILFRIHFF